MEGLVGIYVSSIGNSCLANLGPGEILGDISFIGDIPASASVVAVENSHLLAISRTDLEAKINEINELNAKIDELTNNLNSIQIQLPEGKGISVIIKKIKEMMEFKGYISDKEFDILLDNASKKEVEEFEITL